MDTLCENLLLYSEVQSQDIDWLWYPYIAKGKITILQGDPGDGKSTMMMNLIAEISKGGKTPDGQSFGCSGRVIYQCSEDGVADTIKPRLEKSGADCSNVAFINEEDNEGLTLDDKRILNAIISFKPALLVIDPVQAYLGCDSDIQIAGRVRKLMKLLNIWASTYNCAIVLIGHLNKKEGSKGLYRSLGSIDFVAAARSVLQIERDEEYPSIRHVQQIKNSLGPDGGIISFEITEERGFAWLDCDEIECSDNEKDGQGFSTKQEYAAVQIKLLLKDGDLPVKELFAKLSKVGIGNKLARRAKEQMGVLSYRKNKQWYWKLP